MTTIELRDRLNEVIDQGGGEKPAYVFSDADPMEAELVALEAQEVLPFKPFWTTVEGILIQ